VDTTCETLDCPATSWSASFTAGATPTAQCASFDAWRATLDASGCASITMRGTYDTTGVTCTDPTVVAAIADALRTGTTGLWTCGGHTWHYCQRSSYEELWLDPPYSCSGSNCPNPGYLMRPCFPGSNWGGVNTATCSPPSQTQYIEFH
jgi:hypothetical protein